MASLSHAPFANPNTKQSCSTLQLPSSLPMNPSLLPLQQYEPWLAHLEKSNRLSHNMGSLGLHETSYTEEGFPGDSQDLVGREDPLLTSSWEALDKLVSASISTGSMNEVSENTTNCVMGKGGNNMGSSPNSFSEVEQKPLNLYNTSSNKLSSSSNGGIMWVPTSHANASSIAHSNVGLNLASLISADPGFAERAAKFSSYSQQVNQAYSIHNVPSDSNLAARKLTRIAPHTNKSSASNSLLKANHVAPVPDMAMEDASNEGAHKPCLASKNKEDPPQGSMANFGKKKRAGSKDVDVDDQGNGKRPKTGENVLTNEIKPTFVMKPQQSTSGNSADSEQKSGKEISKSSDAPKPDFIHVRARRGQATDSHSLAERVRREKISERMKYLQDLVPGCSKVTGKAMMLDEIINYVQSLQRQVEFLSMKLAAVHPSKLEFNLENLFGKEVVPHISQNHHNNVAFAPETNINSYPSFLHDSMPLQVNPSLQLAGNPPCTPVVDLQSFGSDASLRRTVSSLISSDTFGSECISQITEAWDDDLQNIVQMGFAQTPLIMPPNLQGPLFHGQMKTEL